MNGDDERKTLGSDHDRGNGDVGVDAMMVLCDADAGDQCFLAAEESEEGGDSGVPEGRRRCDSVQRSSLCSKLCSRSRRWQDSGTRAPARTAAPGTCEPCA